MKNNNFIILFIIIFLLVFLAYSNYFTNSFHFDDSHVIENNAFIQSIKNVPEFFTNVQAHSSVPTNQVYRPLLLSLFAFEYWIGQGLHAFIFHIFSFIFYLLLGILIFLFFLKIINHISPHSQNRYIAVFAVGWYVLNPVNTEAVNYIFQQSEILAALGVLGSFTLYLYKPRRRKTYVYLLPMAIASFAKISALIFVPLLFIYILLFEKKCSLSKLFHKSTWVLIWQAFKRLIPALIIGLLVFIFIQSMNAPTVVLSNTPGWQYLASQPFSLLYYIFSFFLPIKLNADYGWGPVTNLFDIRFIAGIIALIILIYLAVKCSKRAETRPISFGLLWFIIALVPSSSIFPLSEIVNDHRPFLAYIGLVLAVVWWAYLIVKWFEIPRFARNDKGGGRLRLLRRFAPRNDKKEGQHDKEKVWGDRKGWIVFLASAILIASTVGTYNRNKVWQSSETLWYDVIQKNPKNARGLMNYAVAQMKRGKYELAQHYLKKAASLMPFYPYAKINLGAVEEKLNNPQGAEIHFKQALELAPNNQLALYAYAWFLRNQNRNSEAIEKLYHLLKISPSHLRAHYLLMNIYASQYDIIHVSEIAEKVFKIIPHDPTTLQYLAKVQELDAELEQARIQVNENPTAENLFYFGFLNIQANNFEHAIDANKQAIVLNPDYVEAYNNLGVSYNYLGKWDKAIKAFERALSIDPNYNLAKNNLNYALEQQKLQSQAD